MRNRAAFVALLGLVVLVLATPAFASEPAGEDGGAGALMKLEWQEIAIAIVVFLVLVVLLTKLAWKPILDGLQKREDTIRQALDDAERASKEARRLIADYEQKLASAKEEAQAIADEAKRDADEVRRRIEEDARARADETIERARREIEQAKDKAFAELLGDVTSIVTEAASRIVRREITPEANADIVDEVVRSFSEGGRPRRAS